MKDVEKAIIKEIACAIIGIVPGGSLVKGITSTLIDKVLMSSNIERSVNRITKEVTKILFSNPERIYPKDPGRAISAALDALFTIKESGLDADKLIDCNLDPQEIYEFLLLFPYDKAAPQSRIGIYQTILRKFSEKIIIAAYHEENFQLKIHQRILKNQRDILNNSEPGDGGNSE